MVIFGLAFIFFMTVLGCSLVFFLKTDLSERSNIIMKGLASGIMLSTAVFGMLEPSIKYADIYYKNTWIIVSIGFLLGSLFLYILDKIIFMFENGSNNRTKKFFLAISLHNIPEGLAVGLAFGSAIYNNTIGSILGAIVFALGIGIQNIPEGIAISFPLFEMTKSKSKSFLLGIGSGVIEPIFGLFGVLLAKNLSFIMPYALSFAAGTMIYVVFEELIPESNNGIYKKYGTWSAIIGFLLIMILNLLF